MSPIIAPNITCSLFWTKVQLPCESGRRPSGRPLSQRLQHLDFNGDGRTDRASLHRSTRNICVTVMAGEGVAVPFYCVPLRWQLYEEGSQALGAGVPMPL